MLGLQGISSILAGNWLHPFLASEGTRGFIRELEHALIDNC